MYNPVVILGAKRTPIDSFMGTFSSLSASDLGAIAIRAAVAESAIDAARIERAVMGCVLAAGQGQAPARQAAIKAGLPLATGAVTVNKMCGSGMQAVMDVHDALVAQSVEIAVAGGMESMTGAPFLLPRHRQGQRMGHDEVKDSMFLDGLEDAYEPGKLMGAFVEAMAHEYQFTREAQDDYAIESLTRARQATASGAFAAEIAPVSVASRDGETTVTDDARPGRAKPDRIRALKPAFAPGGTITAANASSISDGAAALVLCREEKATLTGARPLARIAAHATVAMEPAHFAVAPVPAIRTVLAKAGWEMNDVDLFEVNEAFAAVAMIAMRDLGIVHEKLNVNGGACALGHPIGASGARIIVTLIEALRARRLRRGIASVCIGGGEATAIALELVK
ncbi:MAG: acetyl-CoA C-acyltransferase [Aestuariivirga sp.]|nr:acetyl-CoA C-acyltransferase [Aestuariivirga sp.]